MLGLDGRLYTVAVYRLDNGYWDCYYEEELHSALRWDTAGEWKGRQQPALFANIIGAT